MSGNRYNYLDDMAVGKDTEPVNESPSYEETKSALEAFINPLMNVERAEDAYTNLRIQPKLKVGTMCPGGQNGRPQVDPHRLLLSSENNMIYRLYFTEMTDFEHPLFQNRFTRLLRSLSSAQVLHIHLGNGTYGAWPLYGIGNMMDALQRATCKVICHCNGKSGFGETCLWLFAGEREISEFGSLYFTALKEHLSWSKDWTEYFRTIFQRAVTLQILDQKEADKLITSSCSIQLLQREVISRINSTATPDPE